MVQSHNHTSLRILLTASSIDLPASVLMTRVIVQNLRYDHGKPVLQSLQWLPTQVRAKSTASAQLCYPNLTPFLLTQPRPLQPPRWASTLQSGPHVRILEHTLPSTSKVFPSWKCMACSLTFFRTCLNIAFMPRSSMTTVKEQLRDLTSVPSSPFPKPLTPPADVLCVFVCMCLFAHLYQNVSSVRVKVLSPVFTRHCPLPERCQLWSGHTIKTDWLCEWTETVPRAWALKRKLILQNTINASSPKEPRDIPEP